MVLFIILLEFSCCLFDRVEGRRVTVERESRSRVTFCVWPSAPTSRPK
jgi:hypothetical protein